MTVGKIALLGLVFCLGLCIAQPSKDEFNLFCRILGEVNDMMHGPEYIYDETKDMEILKEMEVLYNATTDNMNDFRKMLWETKDFFERHPPPIDMKNRQEVHREIGQFIKDGVEKIEENRKLAEKVNQKMEEAKLPVAKGMYGDNVKGVPKEDGDWTAILNDNASIFGSVSSASDSCGNGENKETGKTLINDLFCVCVGGEATNAEGPCHPKIWPPKSWSGNGGTGKWTQIKYGSGKLKRTQSFLESIEKIEGVCRTLMEGKERTKNMPALLDEYVGMIGKGPAKNKDKNKKIFGHSGRSKERGDVNECDGSQGSQSAEGSEKNNEKICVDYTATLKNHPEIPWHTKFRSYYTKMQEAKNIEETILKNRADLLLLKSKAWIAYTREKEDETANLDDMNVSHLFDGVGLPPLFPPPYLLLIL